MRPYRAGDQADRYEGHADLGSGNGEPIPFRIAPPQVGGIGNENDSKRDECRPPAGHMEVENSLDQALWYVHGGRQKRRQPAMPRRIATATVSNTLAPAPVWGELDAPGCREYRCCSLGHAIPPVDIRRKATSNSQKMTSKAASITVQVTDRWGIVESPTVASVLAIKAGASKEQQQR